MPPDPDKRKLRELKRAVKKRGTKHRRRQLKRDLAENPDEANAIMAEQAGVSVEEYASFAGGTRLFSADEALASMTGDGATDLPAISEAVAAFLPASGLVEEEPSLDGLYDDSFLQDHIEREGG